MAAAGLEKAGLAKARNSSLARYLAGFKDYFTVQLRLVLVSFWA